MSDTDGLGVPAEYVTVQRFIAGEKRDRRMLLAVIVALSIMFLLVQLQHFSDNAKGVEQAKTIAGLAQGNDRLTKGIQDITAIGQQAVANAAISPADKAALSGQLAQVATEVKPSENLGRAATTTTTLPKSTTTTAAPPPTTNAPAPSSTTTGKPQPTTTTTTIPPGCVYQETPSGQRVLVCPP